MKIGDGQTVLITGASSGIGAELARCFARDGYALILTARSVDRLESVARELRAAHAVAVHLAPADLAAPGRGAELAAELTRRGLGVDVVVNNAGFGRVGAFGQSALDRELAMIDLNARAMVELTHAFWPGILATGRGGVLNVASAAAFQPGPFMAVYFASKAFVVSFSEALWEEARDTGVKVSCLCPGPTAAGAVRKGLALRPVMDCADVAAAGYRAFQANRRVITPGLMNRVLSAFAAVLPREAVLSAVRAMVSRRLTAQA